VNISQPKLRSEKFDDDDDDDDNNNNNNNNNNMPVNCKRILFDSYYGLMHGKLENMKIVFTVGRHAPNCHLCPTLLCSVSTLFLKRHDFWGGGGV